MTIPVTRRRVRRLAAVAVVIFATGAGLAPPPALAQQDAASRTAASDAQVISYEIPAGPLAPALNRLAREAGLVLVFDPELARGKRTSGLDGQFTPQHALERLLAGTGLGYRITEQNQLVIAPLPDNKREEALLLEPIQVAGQGLGGFRADRSSSATNANARLIETPATVNVLTGDFLDTIQSRQFEDALTYVPGASVQGKGNPVRNKFNLRGFEVNTLTSGGVFVDGFQANRRGYHFDRSLYERVDILKGTSAVLFGVAAPGGVVNYVRKKPRFEPAYRIEGALGSFDLARTTLDATGPLGNSESLAYRVVVSANNGKQTVHGDDDGGGFENDFMVFNPQLTWLTPGGGELNLSYEYNEMNRPSDPGIKRLDSGEILFGKKFVASGNEFDTEQHIGTLEFTQPLWQGWDLFLGAKFVRADNDWLNDSSFFGPLDGSPIPRFTSLSLEDHEQDEYRAEINGEFLTGEKVKHQLTIGFSYLETETSVKRGTASTSETIDPFNPVFGAQAAIPDPVPLFTFGEDPQKRFYLQDYVSIGEKLNIFGGVSYMDFKEGFVSASGSSGFGEDEAFVWNIGAIYNHSARLNPFVSYATSLESQRGIVQGGGLIPSKEGEQIELGLKSEWLDGRLATTVSLFQIDQTNIGETDPSDPTGTFSILAGDQRTRGVELEAVGNITDQFRIIGGYSYLDAEFTESTTGNKGNTPHSVPEQKVSIFGEYAFAGELQGWSAGLGFIHESDRQGDNANTFGLPNYERVDLTLAYQRGPFDFRASVENVFDEDYIAGSGGNGHRLAQGARRFYTLTAGWEF